MGCLLQVDLVFLIMAIALALVLGIVLLGRYDDESTDAEWAALAGREGQRTYRWIQAKIPAEEKAAAAACRRAIIQRGTDEAQRFFKAGQDHLLAVATDRLQLLGGLDIYSRMLDAIAPAPSSWLQRFQLRRSLRRMRRALLSRHHARAEAHLAQLQRELGLLDQRILEGSRVLAIEPEVPTLERRGSGLTGGRVPTR